ncbi:MAG: RNA polymerase sigma factor FliA [Methylococcales bacterium]|nr:RNA polymerase sigma factor FliA [Methylococcales bacterium]
MNGAAMYAAVQSGHPEENLLRHAPLVRRIAHHLHARLPESIKIEDLIQAGMLGLLEAARHYDAGQGASFETYAGIRIRGAMLDEVRRADWTPRSVHRKSRQIVEAIRILEGQSGRDPQDHEVAAFLGISLDEYYRGLQDVASARAVSLDGLAHPDIEHQTDGDANQPLSALGKAEFNQALQAAIGSLPDRERLVLSLYYVEELNLKEIGEVLAVSESRVSQINNQALQRLRAKLTDWQSEVDEDGADFYP